MSRALVLVADDEAEVRSLLNQLLGRAGYEVRLVTDGADALRAVFSDRPDIVLLDVTMPGLDGWTTLERIRDVTDIPVLMLTARTDELEKVRALKAGADDYVTKPFGRQELLARVEVLLRRHRRELEIPVAYSDGLVAVDFVQRTVEVDEREVRLTPHEFSLLCAFVLNANRILSHDQLLELAWRDPYGVSADQVRLYVSYLRKKLGVGRPGPFPIETVRGFGYRYRASS